MHEKKLSTTECFKSDFNHLNTKIKQKVILTFALISDSDRFINYEKNSTACNFTPNSVRFF